jgi:hypothetical protein
MKIGLYNTPNFADSNVTVGAAAFGVISTTANGPRQLQLALQLYFCGGVLDRGVSQCLTTCDLPWDDQP